MVWPAWAAVIRGVSPREFRGSMWLVCWRRSLIVASSPIWAAMEKGVSFGAMVGGALGFKGAWLRGVGKERGDSVFLQVGDCKDEGGGHAGMALPDPSLPALRVGRIQLRGTPW